MRRRVSLALLHCIVACTLAAVAAPAARAATEWWVVAARLDSGDQLLIEFTLTDVGPGERNAAAIGHWIAKDGTQTPFQKAKLGSDWKPSPDGRRIDLGKFVFDRSRARAQLRVEKKSVRIALDFPLAAQPLATQKLAGGKWTQELWAGGARAEASLWKPGLAQPLRTKGRVAVSRRRIEGPEAKLAARRLEAFSLATEPLYVVELAKGKSAERWVVALDAKGAVAGADFTTSALQEKLSAVSPKLSLGGKLANGALLAGTQLSSYDPLAELPGLIRFALGLRLRSVWTASPFDVSVRTGARSQRRQGTAIASYTFYAE